MPVPVISVAQMRAWEQASWAAGRSPEAVIARAGAQVARLARQMTCPATRILVLAGKGHNGDDARQAVPHLGARPVEIIDATSPAAAAAAFEAARARSPGLIIDGLFGIGLNRALEPAWIDLIERVNRSGIPVLAVDTPSGVDADTGENRGAALRAQATLSLGAPKRGLLAPAGVSCVGRLEVAPDIGLIPCPFPRGDTEVPLQWILPEDLRGFPPARYTAGHKGVFGHLGILAGSVGYHGAAVLAARGAQRAQPGLITLSCQPAAYIPIASQLQAVMTQPWTTDFETGPFTAVLAGPGLAAADIPETIRSEVRRLWSTLDQPMVVDASALDWLWPDPFPEGAIRVITPHPGEAARLLRTTAAEIQSNRPRALRELSAHFGDCWVVLKGHQTLVGRFTGDVYVNSSGNPSLGQGGSGDILGGYIAGWLAQPALRSGPLGALLHSVWQHGAAADHLAARGRWIIEELPALLGASLLAQNLPEPV